MRARTLMLAGLLLASLAPLATRAATVAPVSIDADTTWNATGSPYLIYATLTIAPGATLTVEPGTVVKFDPQGFLDISGALVAGAPDASSEVVFTDISDSSYGGDTAALQATSTPSAFNVAGIYVEEGASLSLFHARLRYRGVALPPGSGADTLGYPDMIDSDGALLVADSILENGISGAVGSGFPGGSASTTIIDSTIGTFGQGVGVSIDGGTLTLIDDDISDDNLLQSGLLIPGPQEQPLRLDWKGDELADGQLLPAAPYVNEIDHFLSVDAGQSARIAPGTTFSLSGNGGFFVAGTLSAEGSAVAPITFTPQEEHWGGIWIDPGGVLSLAHATLRQGGEEWDPSLCPDPGNDQAPCSAAIYDAGGDLAASETTFIDSVGHDLLEAGGSADLERVRLPEGARVLAGSLAAHESDIGNVGRFGIENTGAATTSAENDYWGDASGPAEPAGNPGGTGASVSGAVSYAPWLSADPFLAPGPSASSVLFIPGTEASRLYTKTPGGGEKQVWEPFLNTDLPYLGINADGSSKHSLYTKDIIDSVYGNSPEGALLTAFSSDIEVYRGLEQFLDGLVASSTIAEWRAYPYDWRYDPIDIVNDGTLTEEPGGSIKRIYLADVLEEMASSSPTGKVTIVAHSNGGLLAKALAEKLGPSAAQYIDRIILVGTPQFGTPSAIGALLNGDAQSAGLGIVVNANTVRDEANEMPDPYVLLPSQKYFDTIAEAPVIIAGDTLRDFYNEPTGAVNSRSALDSFVVANVAHGLSLDPDDLRTPLPLSPDLLAKTERDHDLLDAWQPPPDITVNAIAGWGQLTAYQLSYVLESGYFYCTRISLFSVSCDDSMRMFHATNKTDDGDGTVVSPSAVGDTSDAWYFDAKEFQDDGNGNYDHLDLTSPQPVQALIEDLLTGKTPHEKYISTSKPPASQNPLTIISSHSPVHILAKDEYGNETGVISIPGTDFALQVKDIPGSSVSTLDDEEYIYLPQDGAYAVGAQGYGNGATTLEVQNVNGVGSVTSDESFAGIPTTASTTANFSVNAGSASDPQVDVNGDGSIDLVVASDTPAILAPADALTLLKAEIEGLVVRPGVKNRLLRQVDLLTGEESGLPNHQDDVELLETLVDVQTGVKLTATQGAQMLQLIKYLKP